MTYEAIKSALEESGFSTYHRGENKTLDPQLDLHRKRERGEGIWAVSASVDLPTSRLHEAEELMFSLGRDRQKVLSQLRSGGDFAEGLCRRAIGISLEDAEVNQVMIPIIKRRTIPARVYVFTRTAWNEDKIEKVRTLLANP